MDEAATPGHTPAVSLTQATPDGDDWYRAIVENLCELVCRFRVDGTILFANDAYARAIGTTRGELLRRNFWSLIPAGEHAAVRELLARLTPDQPEIRIENQFQTVQGVRWFLWTNRAVAFDASGAVSEAQAVGHDLTDIRRSTDALRESEARLRALVRTTSEVAYRMSADWSEMQPLDGRGLVASNDAPLRDWLVRNLPESEHERIRAAIAVAVRHVQPFELEHRVIRPDGRRAGRCRAPCRSSQATAPSASGSAWPPTSRRASRPRSGCGNWPTRCRRSCSSWAKTARPST